jgi:hypothetical protein
VAAGAAVAGVGDVPQFAQTRNPVNADRGDDVVFRDFQATANEALAATADRWTRAALAGAGFVRDFFNEFEAGHRKPW